MSLALAINHALAEEVEDVRAEFACLLDQEHTQNVFELRNAAYLYEDPDADPARTLFVGMIKYKK